VYISDKLNEFFGETVILRPKIVSVMICMRLTTGFTVLVFEKGNNFWLQRSKHGRDRLFADAQALREACLEFVKLYEENPLTSEKVGFSEGVAVRTTINHPRAMTIKGLSLFLNIRENTYYQWKKERADLAEVLDEIEKIIWSQKFGAAAAGLLNANIISRELGLADKTDMTVATPVLMINPPAGERPYPVPSIHDTE